MTDHAKALADALRECRAIFGIEFSAGLMREVCCALAAYDAMRELREATGEDARHPAEVATRENGDLVKRARNYAMFTLGLPNDATKYIALLCEEVDRLSTHQQQGFPVVKVLGHIVNHMAWKDGALIVTVAHQQEGAESELVKRLRACAEHHDENDRPHTARLLEEAADALSRAPQPDTVTEAYNGHAAQHHVALVLHGKFGAQCGMNEAEMWVPIARAALTAALAARRKA